MPTALIRKVSAGAMRSPGARERWNPDDHVVQPESRQELVRGELVEALPGPPGPRGHPHRLGAVVLLCVAPGWVVSTDLLTRRSANSDFATDTCVRRAGRDPATGNRYRKSARLAVAGIGPIRLRRPP